MIVRRRVTTYFDECLNGPPIELAPTDVNDMYVDSLKEQAENLAIPGYVEDSSALGRLSSGQSGVVKAGGVTKSKPRKSGGQSNAKNSPEKK